MEDTKIAKPATSNKNIWYVLGFVAIVLFVIGLLSNRSGRSGEMTTESITPTVTAPTTAPKVRTGEYALTAAKPQTIAVGDTKNLTLTMDTKGHTVVGYDVVLRYNPADVSIGKISSTKSDFMVFQKESEKGLIAVTAVKSTDSKTHSIFAGEGVLNVPVTSLKRGVTWVQLLEQNGRNTAKFQDETTTAYYPAVTSVSIQSVP